MTFDEAFGPLRDCLKRGCHEVWQLLGWYTNFGNAAKMADRCRGLRRG